ncbi:MAG: hypothetical protein QM723_01980 [Myxococcaceae bacterium]
MNSRIAFLASGLVLGSVLYFSCGQPMMTSKCNPSNCTGCCDSSGTCQAGTTPAQCGANGTSCSICSSGSCVSQSCAIGATGGGTATGGGAATGGGTSTGGGAATGGGSATGGGTGTGGGSSFAWDGGHSVNAIKGAAFCNDNVTVENVIVTGIENSFVHNPGGQFGGSFWIADQADQSQGFYVDQFYGDDPSYQAAVGDVLTIVGYVTSESKYTDRVGYRKAITDGFTCQNVSDAGMWITKTGTGTVTPFNVSLPFGDSMGGSTRPNKEVSSAHIFIPGPLTLTNANPSALKRISQVPNDSLYYGFEVSSSQNSGILVDNLFTYDTSDGGVRCDWRKVVLDGGSVTFPNGIGGIWDTFTDAPCYDGGTSCSKAHDAGIVPGTTNTYTYVLYPLDCSELQGDAGP